MLKIRDCVAIQVRVAQGTTPAQLREIASNVSATVREQYGSKAKVSITFAYKKSGVPSYTLPPLDDALPERVACSVCHRMTDEPSRMCPTKNHVDARH